MPNYTITVTDEVSAALAIRAAHDGIMVDELVQNQLTYYIACSLHDFMSPTVPVNTPGLSIAERAQVYAVGVNNGEESARQKVKDLINAKAGR